MIKKIEEMNYYELLEVSPSATKQEIHKAYERVRRVYEPDSIALYSLFTSEETASINQRIEEAYRTLLYDDNRKRYDAMLMSRNHVQQPPPPQPAPKYQPRPIQRPLSLPSENRYYGSAEPLQQRPQQPLQQPLQQAPAVSSAEHIATVSTHIAEFTGPAIKALREQRGLTIRNVADETKVGSRYLEYIETETFQKLPARPYLRGFLVLYAKALGCDPERMTGDYLKRCDAAVSQKPR